MPVVRENINMKKELMIIIEKLEFYVRNRLGNTVGIITDGDLKRMAKISKVS